MNRIRSSKLLVPACVAISLTLGACGERSPDQTVGQRVDSAIVRASEVARDVQEGGREAAQEARSATMGAASQARQAVSGAGARVDDAKITSEVKDGLKVDKDLGPAGIDVDTRDGVVTLKGTAPNAAAKARASEIARNVKDVKSVDNQLALRAG